jgi:hypothetical protein
MVSHTCKSSTWEAEAGGSRVQGQPELHSETQKRKEKKMRHVNGIQEPTGKNSEESNLELFE